MTAAGPVAKINDPLEILKAAAKMELEAVDVYNRFAVEAGANVDSATKQMFESLVNDEETHFDEFDKQLDNIKRFGPSYLALQSFAKGAESAAGA
jgi:bacterioferritin